MLASETAFVIEHPEKAKDVVQSLQRCDSKEVQALTLNLSLGDAA
ncbi:MAG: hypothetical protein ABSD39_18830 [Terriglobales bacterium]|jgi:hypothetical protein